MKTISRLFLLVFALTAVPIAAPAGQTVTVFAAASLQTALGEVVAAYDGEVVVSYGGSGQIARQIALGAPADIVILANVAWMDWLEGQETVDLRNRMNLLGNRLVLIGPKDAEPLQAVTPEALLQRLAGGRFAIGQTRGVPAGIYGRQWLENAGLWEALAPHLAETDTVRGALTLVARKEVPLGLVYATDARAEDAVVTLYEIPDDMHDPVLYPVAEIDRNNVHQVSEFMYLLASKKGAKIFAKQGFSKPGSPP